MRKSANIWKGLAAGVAGGVVASLVMNQFQALLSKWVSGEERSHGAQSLQQGSPDHGVARELRDRGRDNEQDDAAMRLANAISEVALDHHLTRKEKHVAGAVVHYAFGITTGAWYGTTAEVFPPITWGAGLPFGAFVWVTADEGTVPALGLSKAPTEYPLSIHAYALASHFVYGLTAEMVRRAVRRLL
jgi:putative membrane protein